MRGESAQPKAFQTYPSNPARMAPDQMDGIPPEEDSAAIDTATTETIAMELTDLGAIEV